MRSPLVVLVMLSVAWAALGTGTPAPPATQRAPGAPTATPAPAPKNATQGPAPAAGNNATALKPTLPSSGLWSHQNVVDPHSFARFVVHKGKQHVQTKAGKLHPLDEKVDKRYSPSTHGMKELKKQFMSMLGGGNGSVPCHTPDVVALTKWQTPIKNQLGRRTSAQFAAVAALEAALARQQGMHKDLSEQFLVFASRSTYFHRVNKTLYGGCSLWGGGNAHESVAALKNYGTTSTYVTPYLTQDAMNALVKGVPNTSPLPLWTPNQHSIDNFEYSQTYLTRRQRRIARYGVMSWIKLWESDVRNVCTMEKILAAKHEIVVDFKLDWVEKFGVMNYDSSAKGGYHTMLVVGYNKKAGVFLCKNSWGGDRFIKVSYLFMSRAAIGGAVIATVNNPYGHGSYVRRIGVGFLGKWFADIDGERGLLVIRRVVPYRNIGTFYPDSNPTHGIRVRGALARKESNRALNFHIRGRKYKVYLHGSHDASQQYASGVSRNRGIVGVLLSRRPLPGKQVSTQPFGRNDVLGVWKVTVDGRYIGELQLGPYVAPHALRSGRIRVLQTKFQAPDFTDRYSSGHFLYKFGFGRDGHSLVVQLNVGNDGMPVHQTLYLFVHRKEVRMLSGYTRTKAGIVGVYAHKKASPLLSTNAVAQ